MNNPHFRIEDLGDRLKVEINGSGKELINMLCNLIDHEPRAKQLIELALFIAKTSNDIKHEEDDDKALIDMLRKMNIGLG